MLENMKFKRKVLSRKKIISSFLVVLVLSLCLGGFMYGLADSFEDFAYPANRLPCTVSAFYCDYVGAAVSGRRSDL